MPRKTKKKKKAGRKKPGSRKGKKTPFAGGSHEGKQLRDHILEIVLAHPKKAIHQDTLLARLERMGFKLKMQNIGRSIFSEPKLIRADRVIRLATGPEKAARTSEVELALNNQGTAIRQGAAKRKGYGPREEKGAYKLLKPNVPAAREVLNTIIETDNLPDDARHSLLLTVRRLLGGEA